MVADGETDFRTVPGVDVAVEGELSLVLEGRNGAGVPESPDFCVALRGNCRGEIQGRVKKKYIQP